MKQILVSLCAVALFSCGSSNEEVVEKAVKSNTEDHALMIQKIDSLEAIVYAESFNMDEAVTSELLKSYHTFSEKFVGDEDGCVEYMYKAAGLCRGLKLPVKALKYYSRILDDYPNHIRTPEVAFLLAFTYDEDINEKEQAKEAYQDVIDKYPGDVWAIQAEERLKTIDMTDEELIEQFMKKQAEQVDSES